MSLFSGSADCALKKDGLRVQDQVICKVHFNDGMQIVVWGFFGCGFFFVYVLLIFPKVNISGMLFLAIAAY